MRLCRTIAVAAACAAGLIAAAPAAGAGNPILQDCLQHRSGLTGHYTVSQLRHALANIPPESQEYTSCPDVINRALLAAIKLQRNGGGSGSGSFLPVELLIVLAVLVVAAAGFGAQALRNRRRADPEAADEH